MKQLTSVEDAKQLCANNKQLFKLQVLIHKDQIYRVNVGIIQNIPSFITLEINDNVWLIPFSYYHQSVLAFSSESFINRTTADADNTEIHDIGLYDNYNDALQAFDALVQQVRNDQIDPYQVKRGSITYIMNYHPSMERTIAQAEPYKGYMIRQKNARVSVAYCESGWLITCKKLVDSRTILLTMVVLSPEAFVNIFELMCQLLNVNEPSPKPEGWKGIES